MALAKRDIAGRKQQARAQLTTASHLLAQVHGVAMLASVLVRHRQARHVMWRVYEHAVLDWYEHAATSHAERHAERQSRGMIGRKLPRHGDSDADGEAAAAGAAEDATPDLVSRKSKFVYESVAGTKIADVGGMLSERHGGGGGLSSHNVDTTILQQRQREVHHEQRTTTSALAALVAQAADRNRIALEMAAAATASAGSVKGRNTVANAATAAAAARQVADKAEAVRSAAHGRTLNAVELGEELEAAVTAALERKARLEGELNTWAALRECGSSLDDAALRSRYEAAGAAAIEAAQATRIASNAVARAITEARRSTAFAFPSIHVRGDGDEASVGDSTPEAPDEDAAATTAVAASASAGPRARTAMLSTRHAAPLFVGWAEEVEHVEEIFRLRRATVAANPPIFRYAADEAEQADAPIATAEAEHRERLLRVAACEGEKAPCAELVELRRGVLTLKKLHVDVTKQLAAVGSGGGGSLVEVRRLAELLISTAANGCTPAEMPERRPFTSADAEESAAVRAVDALVDVPTELPSGNAGRDVAVWQPWLEEVAAALEAQEKALTATLRCSREDECRRQHEAAVRDAEAGEAALTEARPLVQAWLRAEGRRRVMESMLAQERERLRVRVLSERAAAFRLASGTPVADRLAARRAVRELAVTQAAEAELQHVLDIVVQSRVYHTGTVYLDLVDGREGEKVAALANSESEREAALSNLASYLGEADEERLYTISAERVSIEVTYSASGTVTEPATRLVIGVRREQGSEQPASQLIAELQAVHQRKGLAEQLGIPSDSVAAFDVKLPDEAVEDGPTIVHLIHEARSELTEAREKLAELTAHKQAGKVQLRRYQSVDGALNNLLRLGALSAVGIDSSAAACADELADEASAASDPNAGTEAGAFPSAGQASQADPAAAVSAVGAAMSSATSRLMEQVATRGFAISNFKQLQDQGLLERQAREERRATRAQLCRVEGRLFLLSLLQESEAGREVRRAPTTRRATQHSGTNLSRSASAANEDEIDIRWNVGLSPAPAPADGSPAKCQLCYFCAGLSPPVRATHTMIEW